MTTIHFIGGEKGGVGKSVVARLLAQSFVDRAQAFTAFDADRSNGALLRYYADFSERIDLDRLDSADRILESAFGADRPVLVDLPAQSDRALQRWFEQTDVLRFAREEGVDIVFWHVTDGGFDSVTHLERLLDTLGNSVHFVVVQNLGRSKDFSQFEASPARQRVLELGGQIVALPELDASVMYKIDRFGSSFWAAINTTEGPRALSALERRRAKVWLDRAHAALDPAGAARPARAESPRNNLQSSNLQSNDLQRNALSQRSDLQSNDLQRSEAQHSDVARAYDGPQGQAVEYGARRSDVQGNDGSGNNVSGNNLSGNNDVSHQPGEQQHYEPLATNPGLNFN